MIPVTGSYNIIVVQECMTIQEGSPQKNFWSRIIITARATYVVSISLGLGMGCCCCRPRPADLRLVEEDVAEEAVLLVVSQSYVASYILSAVLLTQYGNYNFSLILAATASTLWKKCL